MNTHALFDLTGRVALVTGGNGGIGRGIAIGLADAGAAVAVFGRNEDKNGRILDDLKAIGRPSLVMNVDVTDRDGLQPAFLRVERELGGVDILVNNAGHANLSGGVLLEHAADWDGVIEAQLNAVFLLSKLAAAAMVTRRRGKIINVGSMYSFFGSGLIPSYSAANENLDAGSAAGRVGYESASQFSREYSRLFGGPPQRDIAHAAHSRRRRARRSPNSSEAQGW